MQECFYHFRLPTRVQVWDQDIVGSNDALGEATISPKLFERLLVAAYQKKKSVWLDLDKSSDVTVQKVLQSNLNQSILIDITLGGALELRFKSIL